MTHGIVLSRFKSNIWIQTEHDLFWCPCEDSRLVLYQNVHVLQKKRPSLSRKDVPTHAIPSWIWFQTCFQIHPTDIIHTHIEPSFSIITGRLCLSSKTHWGTNSRGMRIYTFLPHSREYPIYCVASSHNPSPEDVYVRIEILPWKEDEPHPKGILVATLGKINNMDTYEDTLCHGYTLVPRERNKMHRNWSRDTCAHEEHLKTHENVEDWTNVPTYSIDPPNCFDIDDAISLNMETQEVAIHIAHPTLAFQTSHPIHSTAKCQNSTVYQSKIQHLLPEKLVSQYALTEGKERTCLSVIFDFDGFSNTKLSKLSGKIAQTRVRVDKNLDYETAHAHDPQVLQSLYNVVLGNDPELHNTHHLVEKSMIAANEHVAQFLFKNKNGIFRSAQKNKRAYYALCNEKHEPLGLSHYTHFTSPLRRFADQLVHRCITENYIPTLHDVNYLNRQNYNSTLYASETYLVELLRAHGIQNEESICLKGQMIYTHENYASVLVENDEQERIFSFPLFDHMVHDFFEIVECENTVFIKNIANPELSLEWNIPQATECRVYWNSHNGLQGFKYVWVHPPIQSWIQQQMHVN